MALIGGRDGEQREERTGTGAAEPKGSRDFIQRWRTSEPPLKPPAEIGEAIAALLPDGPVLLLGVTPELAAIPRRLVAVDWNERMLAEAWLGDTALRRACLGDWRSLPLDPGSFAAAIGDGSLTMLRWPDDQQRVLEQLRLVLRPGGRAIFRCFARPERPEDLGGLREQVLSGALGFHAFKLRFNMAVAAGHRDATIACAELFDRFQDWFPDREALARASGWSMATIAEIDAYRDSPAILSFASRAQLQAMLQPWASPRFVETSGYPCAHLCPLLVVEFP